MGTGLGSSMWAPVEGGGRRESQLNRHEGRSRSVPAGGAAAAAAAVAVAANATKTTSSADATRQLRLQSFRRLEQTCLRLRWKFIDLQSSYERALRPREWGFTTEEAERNFKVDFHEFYTWIEQAVVFALLVFGVVVSAAGRREGRSSASSSSHAYHHNVLRALDGGGPLHGALGVGDVNRALWKAKELRNRWKEAAAGRETAPLAAYDLRWIVTAVLCGLEEAYGLAGREVEGDLRREREGEDGNGDGDGDGDGWEWMVESMDWELT